MGFETANPKYYARDKFLDLVKNNHFIQHANQNYARATDKRVTFQQALERIQLSAYQVFDAIQGPTHEIVSAP